MKLVVSIEPGWFHGVHDVEVDLGEDYDDYEPQELESAMSELAEDTFNNEVSYGWRIVDDRPSASPRVPVASDD